MERTKIELWISPEQEERWIKEANSLGLTLFEYIRRSVDAYLTIIHQYDDSIYDKVLVEE